MPGWPIAFPRSAARSLIVMARRARRRQASAAPDAAFRCFSITSTRSVPTCWCRGRKPSGWSCTPSSELTKLATAGPRLGLEIGLGSGVISIELLARFRVSRMMRLRAEPRPRRARDAQRILARSPGGVQRGSEIVRGAKTSLDVWEPFRPELWRSDGAVPDQQSALSARPRDPHRASRFAEHEPRHGAFRARGRSALFLSTRSPRRRRISSSPTGESFSRSPHERARADRRALSARAWELEFSRSSTDLDGLATGYCASSHAKLGHLMDKMRIRGGKPLHGKVEVSGSKNAALPDPDRVAPDAARPAGSGACRTFRISAPILKLLAAHGRAEPEHARSSNRGASSARLARDAHEAPYDLVRTMRASVLVLGPLLARFGAGEGQPSGRLRDRRASDQLSSSGLEKLGAEIDLEGGYVIARAAQAQGRARRV